MSTPTRRVPLSRASQRPGPPEAAPQVGQDQGFEAFWQTGVDFDPGDIRYEQSVDDMRGSILRLMSLGYKDDIIARRMGMSTRTVRKYITEIADELGTTSRFQTGVRAALLGLVPSPDTVEPRAAK